MSASALGHGGAAAANVGSEEAGPGGGVSQSALALHFEKKAPFPTINLLRARQVRAAANQVQYVLCQSIFMHTGSVTTNCNISRDAASPDLVTVRSYLLKIFCAGAGGDFEDLPLQ